MTFANSMCDLVGQTPIVKINKLTKNLKGNIFAKLENFNPYSSVKDRIGHSMIIDAEKNGLIRTGGTIIEPTSGNTGIALAWVAAVKNYKVILTMPDTMSIERRSLLKALGAKIVLTPGSQGMKGAIQKAKQIKENTDNSIILSQFENPENPNIHYKTTGPEIWDDLDGNVDIIVAGIGTGGTISGIGKFLKEKNPNCKVIGVEPFDSPVLTGGAPGPHLIQGIGAGFIPKNVNQNIIDEYIAVKNEQAFTASRDLAKHEGIFCGISAGANFFASLEALKKYPGTNIATIICDTGERYLSTSLFK